MYEINYNRNTDTCCNTAKNGNDCFICSKCDIVIVKWKRIINGIYYGEYDFKFCPNCGRTVKSTGK